MSSIKNNFLTIITALGFAASIPALASACPRVTTRIGTLPLGIASNDDADITFKLSARGSLTVKRELANPVPSNATSCQVTLQGRYSRKLKYSRVLELGKSASLAQSVRFRVKRLPSVNAERFRGQVIQPTLHAQVVTECTDVNGAVVLSNTSPVVARYAQCGFSNTPVSMRTFVRILIRKLKRTK